MRIFRALSICFLVLLSLAGCRLGPEGGIAWNTEALIPIAYSRVGIFDAVPDTTFETDGDGYLRLVYRDTLETEFIGQSFELPDTSIDLSVTLDTLELATDTIVERITLEEVALQLQEDGDPLGAIILANDGNNLPILPPGVQGLSSGPIEVDASDFFEEAELEAGELVVEIVNEFPLDLSNVKFRMANKTLPGPDLVNDSFPTIVSRTSVSRTYDLAGRELEAELEGELSNIDIDPGLALINLQDYIEIRLIAQKMKARRATAIFPAQTLLDTVRTTDFSFTGSQQGVELTKAVVSAGRIEALAKSTVEDSVAFRYQLLGATNEEGVIPDLLIKMPPAPPGGEVVETRVFDLGGFTLDLTGEGATFNSIRERTVAELLYSGNLVTLLNTDSVSVSFSLLDLDPIYIEGYIGQQRIEFTGEEAIDFFENIEVDRIRLSEARADFVIGNSVGVDANIVLKDFSARNSQSGQEVQLVNGNLVAGPLDITGPQLPDTSLSVETPISFTADNSNLNTFLSSLPDRVSYDLEVVTNPDGFQGTRNNFATDSSQISALIDLELPLAGIVENLILQDTAEIDWSSVELPEELGAGELTLFVGNEFPLELRIDAWLYDENFRPITQLLTQQVVSAADVDANGRSVGANTSALKVEFTPDEIIEWTDNASHMVFQLYLNTRNDGEPIRIYADYGVDVSLSGQFEYRISSN